MIADAIEEDRARHEQKDCHLTLIYPPRGSANNHKTSEER
jgi:hypothetical protein